MRYENGGTARRNSNWQLIGYTESLCLTWRDEIAIGSADWYISPLHDKDVFVKDESHKNSDGVVVEHKAGEKKKPHYHVLVKFDSLKSWEQVKEWACDTLGFAMVQSVMSWQGSLRYLCHLDGGTGKELYNVKDVQCCNDDYLTRINQATDKAVITRSILEYISKKQVKNFHNLVAWALEQGSDFLNDVRTYAYFYRSICQSVKAVSDSAVKSNTDNVSKLAYRASDFGKDSFVPF